MKTLRIVGLILVSAVATTALRTMFEPAVAYAQAMASGGSDACTGQDCVVDSLTATGNIAGATAAFSGTVTSTAGAGTNAYVLATNARIANSASWCRFSATGIWQCNAGVDLINGNLGMTGVGARLDLYDSVTLQNTAAQPVKVDDAQGLLITPKSSLPTCSTTWEGMLHVVARSGATDTKVCVCLNDNGTAAWRNLANPAAGYGDTTTCPDT